MISFDSICNIVNLLGTIRDDVNNNHPELAEKEWFQQTENVLSYLDSIKSLVEF